MSRGVYERFIGFSPEPTVADWARLAAFIDGEGHIGIYRSEQAKYHPRAKSPQIMLRVGVSNTSEKLINWLMLTFGGRVQARQRSGKWKACFDWQAFGYRAEAVLRGVLPYLIIKCEQAENGIKLRELLHNGRNHHNPLSDEELRQRVDLLSAQRTLNLRGRGRPLVN